MMPMATSWKTPPYVRMVAGLGAATTTVSVAFACLHRNRCCLCQGGKRLPICVVSAGPTLMPLVVPKQLAGLVPRSVGNREIAAVSPLQEAARSVASAITSIVREMGWNVERIAVDAPAAPPATGTRASESELGLSSFRTPATSAWAGIREKCANHLELGGTVATLPHANMIWMLFGFELVRQALAASGPSMASYHWKARQAGSAHFTSIQ